MGNIDRYLVINMGVIMFGKNFPVSEFYREHIIDAETIARSGTWWTAVLLIKDPRKNTPFIGLYRWQNTAAGWKMRDRFYFRSEEQAQKIIQVIHQFTNRLLKKETIREEEDHKEDK